METDLYNTTGNKIDKIELPNEIFKAKINPVLMAQAVRVYLANQRQGTQAAKTRGEVSGSGRKIYRQKGTGLARHGDRYAPLFVGGGVAFPPKPRDFSLQLTKKARRKALFSALSQKLNEKGVIFISNLNEIKGKTKEMVLVLKNLGLKEKEKILLILPGKLNQVILAARNIENLSLTRADLLNTYSILNNQKIILLKDSLTRLKEVFGEKKLLKEKVVLEEQKEKATPQKEKQVRKKIAKKKVNQQELITDSVKKRGRPKKT